MELARFFLAIAPDELLRGQLASLCATLKPRFATEPWRWVASENYHLTPAFIGTVRRSDIARTAPRLALVMAGLEHFGYRLTRLGCFPDTRRPRAIAALPERQAALESWQVPLVAALEAGGIAVERRAFRAHLTLARWRGRQAPARPLEETIALQGVANAIVMYESRDGRYLPQFTLAAGRGANHAR